MKPAMHRIRYGQISTRKSSHSFIDLGGGGGGGDLGPFEPSYPTQARHLISKENINHFFTRFPRVIKSSAISRTFLLKNVMLTWFMNVHNNHFMFIIP